MIYLFKGYQIDYDYTFNNKKTTIIFLHGWGGNKFSFCQLEKFLNQNFNILKISFPPYFMSTNKNLKSTLALTIYDYRDIVLNLIILHNIKSIYIICHSFGFRIALLLFSKKLNIQKLIVTGGAGINFEKSRIKTISLNSKILFSKQTKITIDCDYNKLNFCDKQTFKNIVNKNLKNYSSLINCNTLLFWGKNDKDTPIKICKFLKHKVKNSQAKIVKSDHFAYLNFSKEFINETLKFINS